jgi:hypothetical protein
MLDHPTDAFFVLRHLQRLVQLCAEALPPAVDRLCHLHFFQQVALLAQVSVERPEHEHGERTERKCRAHREDVVRVAKPSSADSTDEAPGSSRMSARIRCRHPVDQQQDEAERTRPPIAA